MLDLSLKKKSLLARTNNIGRKIFRPKRQHPVTKATLFCLDWTKVLLEFSIFRYIYSNSNKRFHFKKADEGLCLA